MKYKILIAATLFVNAYFLQSCDNSTKTATTSDMDNSMTHKMQNDSMNSDKMDDGMMQSMKSMMGNMNNMKMTGDFDHDFATMMIMHHQGAIDMSEAEIAKGSDAQMKTMAQNIIVAQKAEIDQMQKIIKSYKMPEDKKMNGKMHNELGETMKVMMDKIEEVKRS